MDNRRLENKMQRPDRLVKLKQIEGAISQGIKSGIEAQKASMCISGNGTPRGKTCKMTYEDGSEV